MTDTSSHPVGEGAPELRTMTLADLSRALRCGWQDFRARPMFGLAVGAGAVAGGWGLYLLLFRAHLEWLAIPLTFGFPLIGPFLAVGLYEVSRRLQAGDTDWAARDILGVIWRQRLRQLPTMAWVIIIYFLFWSFFAHMLFALFLGPSSLTNVTTSYAYLLEPEGLSMMLVGTAFGAVFAAVLFALTVVALPLLLDREVDFVTAMITSVAVVRLNPLVMFVWGVVIAGMTFLAMLPGLTGLLVVLPVLGHGSWHIYRLATVPR